MPQLHIVCFKEFNLDGHGTLLDTVVLNDNYEATQGSCITHGSTDDEVGVLGGGEAEEMAFGLKSASTAPR